MGDINKKINELDDSFKTIGVNKYNQFKQYDFDKMQVDQLLLFKKMYKMSASQAIKEIKKFESKNSFSIKSIAKIANYYENIKNKRTDKKVIKFIDKKWLYNRFLKAYFNLQEKKFIENKNTISNIEPLIYYFIGDFDKFKKCKNVSTLSKPSMNKGLLLIGPYGNGKTSIMQALEAVLHNTNASFLSFGCKQIVQLYEHCTHSWEKKNLWSLINSGTRLFDDALRERVASNYGLVDIIKDTLEERDRKKLRTYLTINFRVDKDGNIIYDIQDALNQFGEKYDGALYDRIFSNYNIIEFKGPSLR